jgi:hypothetical protein
MTSSQLALYLAFALGCGLIQFLWLQLLADLHRRRFRIPETLLNVRQRQALERSTRDSLALRCIDSASERETFLQSCRRHLFLSDELLAHLRRRPEIVLRLIADAVAHLPDHRLIQLAAQLGCTPRETPRLTCERPLVRRRFVFRWNVSQRVTVAAAFAALLAILLMPPWVAERQRQIRVLGVSRSLEMLERQTIGYHWLLDTTIPARKIKPRVTESFGRLEFDEYGWRIDYPRLCLQLVTFTLASGVLIWLRPPGNSLGPSMYSRPIAAQA